MKMERRVEARMLDGCVEDAGEREQSSEGSEM